MSSFDDLSAGDREFLLQTLENYRNMTRRTIDTLGEIIQRVQNGQPLSGLSRTQLLAQGSHELKGNKPLLVRFPDGREVPVKTWLEAASVILEDCNSDPVMHERLMELRGKVLGKSRVILGEEPDMNVSLRIDESLYMEGKFDTETLFHVLTQRVLWPVGYDCRGIEIEYCTPEQMRTEEPEEQSSDPELPMEQML